MRWAVSRTTSNSAEPATGQIVEVGVTAVDYVAGSQMIAFRVAERIQGAILNNDGDCDDIVMVGYEFETGTIRSFGRNALLCDFSVCPPGTKYGVVIISSRRDA